MQPPQQQRRSQWSPLQRSSAEAICESALQTTQSRPSWRQFRKRVPAWCENKRHQEETISWPFQPKSQWMTSWSPSLSTAAAQFSSRQTTEQRRRWKQRRHLTGTPGAVLPPVSVAWYLCFCRLAVLQAAAGWPVDWPRTHTDTVWPRLPLHRALREQVLAQATADPEAQGASGEYKGINNYTDYKKVGRGVFSRILPTGCISVSGCSTAPVR